MTLLDINQNDGKLPFSYEILTIIDKKLVKAKIILTKNCINRFGIMHGGIHALVIDEIGMSTFQKLLWPNDNYLTKKLTVEFCKTSRDLVLLGEIELINLDDNVGKIQVKLTSLNGTVKSVGLLEFQVRQKFKKYDVDN